MMKKVYLLILMMLVFSTCADAKDITNTVLTIDETQEIKTVDAKMFGVSSDWLWDTNAKLFFGNDPSMTKTPDEILSATRGQGLKIPLSRAGGGSANTFYWKKMLNEPDAKQKKFGIVEYVRGSLALDPDAEISVTLNLDDTDENLYDLVRFLTLMPEDAQAIGTDGTNWAEERIRQGILEPVPVAVLVFGNELDWLGGLDDPDGLNWTTQRYIARCRELIPGIRAINPKIPLGVFSKTATSGFADHGEAWNKEIILNLGPDVDMIAFHNYYHINNAALLEMSGHSLEVIEKFIAPEYNTSHLKIYLEEHGHFEDWTDAVERTKIQAFKGAMSMAMHFCRRLQDPMISMATFHGISGEFPEDAETNILSSEIMQAYRDEDGREVHMLTSSGEMLRLMQEQFSGKTVVESNMAHKKTSIFYREQYKYVNETPYKTSVGGWYPHVNSVVAKDENGVLTIMFANRGGWYPGGDEYGDPEEDITVRDLQLATKGKYQLAKKIEMYANPEYNLGYDSRNTLKNPDQTLTVVTNYENPQAISTFTVEPRKITILTLIPADQTGKMELRLTNTIEKAYLETVTEPSVKLQVTTVGIDAQEAEIMLFLRAKGSVNVKEATPIATQTVLLDTLQQGVEFAMPHDAKTGMYTVAVKAGGMYAKEEFYYEKAEQPSAFIQAVEFPDLQEGIIATNGQIRIKAMLPDTTPNGYRVGAVLCRGQLRMTGDSQADERALLSDAVAIGQATASGGIVQYQFALPKSKEHDGIYTLFLGDSQTELTYCYDADYPVKLQKIQGNSVWLGADGVYAALQTDQDFLVKLLAAGYDAGGKMISVAADQTTLPAGESLVKLDWQQNGMIKQQLWTDNFEDTPIYVQQATQTVNGVTPQGQDLNNGVAGITSGSDKELSAKWKTSQSFGGKWFQTIYQVQKDKAVSNAWAGDTDQDLENQVISLKTVNNENSKQAAVVYRQDLPENAEAYVYRADLRNYFGGECNPVMGIRITDPQDETTYYELALISNTGAQSSEEAAKISPPRFSKVYKAGISTPDEASADTWQYVEYGTEKTASGCWAGNGLGHHCDWFCLEMTQYQNGALSWRVIRKSDERVIWSGEYLDPEPLFLGAGNLTVFTYGGASKILVDNALVGTQTENADWRFMVWNDDQTPLTKVYQKTY